MEKTSSKEHPLPVSRKYYTTLLASVRTALTAVGLEFLQSVVRTNLDRYLAGDYDPEQETVKEVKLIFALLRSQIDKAMARSAAARERAARRRLAGPRSADGSPRLQGSEAPAAVSTAAAPAAAAPAAVAEPPAEAAAQSTESSGTPGSDILLPPFDHVIPVETIPLYYLY